MRGTETVSESLAILNAVADLKDERLKDGQLNLLEFIKSVERRHAPLTGEAYPEDRNRYCAVCMSSDGGSCRWPCSTLKNVWKYLRPRDRGEYGK